MYPRIDHVVILLPLGFTFLNYIIDESIVLPSIEHSTCPYALCFLLFIHA